YFVVVDLDTFSGIDTVELVAVVTTTDNALLHEQAQRSGAVSDVGSQLVARQRGTDVARTLQQGVCQRVVRIAVDGVFIEIAVERPQIDAFAIAIQTTEQFHIRAVAYFEVRT